MAKARRVMTVLSMSVWMGACSGGGVSDPGVGSATLSVDAHVSAENRIVNASAKADFDTSFEVRLSKSGAALHGATVKLGSDRGEVILVEDTQKEGRYVGEQSGYAGTYSLSAVLGADNVDGVALTGPAAHAFSAPLLGAQVIYGQPLDVKWSPSGADAASLDTRELDNIAVADTGEYTVPGSGLKKPDTGKTAEERVRVVRSSSVALAGAVAGSKLTVSISNEITFVVLGQ